ncbi:MAG: hypothetical protein LBL36_05835, partial [Clostridiales Family XIII bacterium]|nr:hypothetical protein [Clostridiales Family XIII bacterium]
MLATFAAFTPPLGFASLRCPVLHYNAAQPRKTGSGGAPPHAPKPNAITGSFRELRNARYSFTEVMIWANSFSIKLTTFNPAVVRISIVLSML